MSAMFGNLLTWMNESQSLKYTVATSNDISEMLSISQGAMVRAGRIDDIFFIDVPPLSERREILEIMNKKYRTNYDLDLAERMQGYTGAEIEKWVTNSIYEGEDASFNMIKPICNQARDSIDALRSWAIDNVRMANATDEKWTMRRRLQVAGK